MEFTFGIITNGTNDFYVKRAIESIQSLHIPNFEIIIVGGNNQFDGTIHIPFDESMKPNWITRKKNIICDKAQYENIVLIHDYVEFCDDWYNGFIMFGNDFDICVTKIKNQNGMRFRDYTIFPYGIENTFGERALVPYNYPSNDRLSKLLYISGAYYIIKKKIAIQFPLDERLSWGDGEDVELSKRLINHNILLRCNSHSTVRFQKQKQSCHWEQEMNENDIMKFENLSFDQLQHLHNLQMNNLREYIFNCTSLVL